MANDPTIQRVLHELNLAVDYGVTGNGYDYFVAGIYKLIPDLKSSLPNAVKLIATPTIPTPTPAPIAGTTEKAIALAAGGDHTCVLTSNGAIKCRGWNWLQDQSQNMDEITAPQVVAGDGYTCVLTNNSGVKCIGKNNLGQLGDAPLPGPLAHSELTLLR